MAPTPPRFTRLLTMVPYFLARPGIKVATAAKDLGITEAALIRDLEQLFVCGLPGYMPDDLIDIQFDDGYVRVHFAAGMDRPLRLTGTEASVLLVALRMLLDAPGVSDPDATRRAIAKLEQAVGGAGPAVAAPVETPASDNPVYAALRAGVRDRVAVEIEYYTASRDEVSTRVVDPIRVRLVDGQTYLEAWCRNSETRKLFRFDRVSRASLLGEPSNAPAETARARPLEPVDPEALNTARIDVDPGVTWIFEYYPATPDEEVTAPDHPVSGTMSYGSTDWLARLVLGFGGRVRITSTDELSEAVRRQVRAQAEQALAQYGSPGVS